MRGLYRLIYGNEIWIGYLGVFVLCFHAVFSFEMKDLWHVHVVETLNTCIKEANRLVFR